MYRIDTGKLSDFRETTENLRQQIEETKEACIVQVEGIADAWEGDAAEEALQAGQELVRNLNSEAEVLYGLGKVLETAVEKSHMLLSQSRKFADILRDGEESTAIFTGHGYQIGTPLYEGVIMLEESTVADVVSGCNRTAEYAREIEDITYEIDAIMNSLEYANIDISAQTAQIRKDCKKVERIEEYGRSYGRYAEEFIELDNDLRKALELYTTEKNKGFSAKIYEPALWGGELNVERILFLLSCGRDRLTYEETQELKYALNRAMDGRHPEETTAIIEAIKHKMPDVLTDLERQALVRGMEAEILWTAEQTLIEIQRIKTEQSKGKTEGPNMQGERMPITEDQLISRGIVANEATVCITALSMLEQMLWFAEGLEQTGFRERNTLEFDVIEREHFVTESERIAAERQEEMDRQCFLEIMELIAEEKARQQEKLDEAKDFSGYSPEELKEAYESIPNYNILERSYTDYDGSKHALNTIKQFLSPVYNDVARSEAMEVLKEEGLLEQFAQAYLEIDMKRAVLLGTFAGHLPDEETALLRKELSEKTGLPEEDLQNLADDVQREMALEISSDMAEEHPVLISGASLVMNLGGTEQGALAGVYSWLTGEPVKEDGLLYLYQDANKEARNTVRNGIKTDRGKFFYDVGMSVGDSLIALAAGGGNPLAGAAIRAVDTYSKTVQEGAINGQTPEQMQMMGVSSAGIEFATEAISFKAIFGIKGGGSVVQALQDTGGKGVKQVLGHIGSSMLTEGGGEVITEICHTEADYLINGNNSEIVKIYNGYLAQGMSEEEAYDATVKYYAAHMGQTFVAGAVAGGLMSGGVEVAGHMLGGRGTDTSTTDGSAADITEIEGATEQNGTGQAGRANAGEGEGGSVVTEDSNILIDKNITGMDWYEYFRETYGKKNVRWENCNPSEVAAAWQGNYPYVGIDNYTNITLHDGNIIWIK